MRSSNLDRRALLRGAAIGGAGLGFASWFPAWAQPVSAGIARPLPTISGSDIALRIAHQMMTIDGRDSHAIGVNGTVPAPLIRLKQGRSEEHTSELQSLMRISYAVFCLKQKKNQH